MRALALLALLLLPSLGHAAALAAPPALPGIIGKDDRRVIDADEQKAWNAVGRLNRENDGFCSAVLVAPTEVLTAAHCLWDHQHSRWLEPEMLHFVPGYRRGAYLGHAKGIAFRLAPTIEMSKDGRPTELVDDWAVVVLDLNLETGAGIRPLEVAGPSDRDGLARATPLLRAGYGSDRPHLPVLVEHCAPLGLSAEGRLLLHDCDATLGDSGSPILIRRNGKLVVLGVQTSVVQLGDDAAGVAVIMQRQLPATALLGKRE